MRVEHGIKKRHIGEEIDAKTDHQQNIDTESCPE
jgi:hypothetical protein